MKLTEYILLLETSLSMYLGNEAGTNDFRAFISNNWQNIIKADPVAWYNKMKADRNNNEPSYDELKTFFMGQTDLIIKLFSGSITDKTVNMAANDEDKQAIVSAVIDELLKLQENK